MTSSRRASLLVVLAHPDDEIFHGGMLTHLSEQGVRVTLVVCHERRGGQAASVGRGGRRPRRLARRRAEAVLRQARHRAARASRIPRLRPRRPPAARRRSRAGERGHARGRGRHSAGHRGREAAGPPHVRSARRLLPSRSSRRSARHDGRILFERRDGRRRAGAVVLRHDAARRVPRPRRARVEGAASPTASTPTCSERRRR